MPGITPLRTLDRTSPTFKDDLDAFFGGEMQTFSVEAEAARVEVLAKEASAVAAAATATDEAGVATTQAGVATTKAGEAAGHAASALNAPGTNATSATNMTVGTGDKTFTLAQAGKTFAVGQWVSIADSATPSSNWMLGGITAFNAGTGVMTVSVANAVGSLTGASWVIAAAAPVGSLGLAVTPVAGAAVNATAGKQLVLNNVAATAVTMPNALTAGDRIAISPNNGLRTNTVNFGAKTVRGPNGTATGVVTLDMGATMNVVAVDANTWMML